MTWVDLAVLGVLSISALLAFMRGLVREVLGIAAWVGAVAVAMGAMPFARDIVRTWLSEPEWVDPVSFVALFLITLIILSLVARMIGRAVRGSLLGGVDRTLGLVFGLGRGAALIIFAYIIGNFRPVEHWPDPVLKAAAMWPAFAGASWVVEQIPADLRSRLPPLDPPPGRQVTADTLLHASPLGRATGKQPARD